MAIKVYSDRTNKFYDTVEEANKAEFELKEKENLAKIQKERAEAEAKAKKEKEAAERKAAAEKVEAARKAVNEARETCNAAEETLRKELTSFCAKYGPYHFSSDKVEDFVPELFNWKDWISTIFKF